VMPFCSSEGRPCRGTWCCGGGAWRSGRGICFFLVSDLFALVLKLARQ
jgi:hypothetical protein